jgi:phospholipid transport system substrate-binding protein
MLKFCCSDAGGLMIRKNYVPWSILLCSMMFCMTFAFAEAATTPGDQIQTTINKVLDVLKDPGLKNDKTSRFQRLREIIEPQFDFAEMAKRSLGSQWQRRTPEEQKEFVHLFTDLVENSYVDTIDSYDGEKVIVTNQKQDQNYAQVNTKIVTKKGEEFSIAYKLMSGNDGWKIYDVVVEDISLVNNYRSQFGRILSKSSYDDLIRRMRQKEMAAPAKKS